MNQTDATNGTSEQPGGALAGVRVIDCTDYIAGPYCGMMLADLGADVIKVEPTTGDRWRLQSQVAPGESRGFLAMNRGKRGIAVDLHRPEGLALLLRLLDGADVFLTNFRPGVAERLGLGWEQLSARNPRLIYAENTAFGSEGPDAARPGFDLLSQAASGLLDYEQKLRNGLPAPISSTALADVSSGMFLAYGIAGALYARERSGRGQRIAGSLLHAAISVQYRPFQSVESIDAAPRAALLEALAARSAPEPQTATGDGAGTATAAPPRSYAEIVALREAMLPGRAMGNAGNTYYRPYETRDGIVCVACLNNRFRRRLRDLLGIADPSVDGDTYALNDPDARAAALALRPQFEAAFRERTTAEWLRLLDEADVPCTPLRLTEEVFDSPQIAANEMIVTLEHPTLGTLRQPAGPLRMSDTPYGSRRAAPTLGQHTDAVLAEAGLSPNEVAALHASGVVR
ncbi:MAG TPA: CoA transferase [Dehalococcoidia bacterium]|nr:CoA transferase [Dehalococcoidia bacterium]